MIGTVPSNQPLGLDADCWLVMMTMGEFKEVGSASLDILKRASMKLAVVQRIYSSSCTPPGHPFDDVQSINVYVGAYKEYKIIIRILTENFVIGFVG